MSYSGGFSARHVSSSESESSKITLHEPELTQEERFNQILLQADDLMQKDDVEKAIEKLRLLS